MSSRPSLSKETPRSQSQANSRPSFVYNKLQEKALSLLPARRSPTKAATPSTSATVTTASISKRSNPFAIFSRHKPSASAPAAVHSAEFQQQQQQQPTNARPPSISQPPPVPPKSAPPTATRTVVPGVPLKDGSSSQPGSQSLRSRPTAPFATSNVLRPTAASSARTLPSVSSTSSSPPSARPPFLSHTRSTSKQKVEPTLVSSPSTSQTAPIRPRVSPSPTLERTSPEPKQQQSSSNSSPQRPRPGARTPTSPPSAFAMKPSPHSLPSRLLPRKRSKTFPDPNDPVVPVPPSTSRAMKTANRIVEAFEPSPRADDPSQVVVTSPISPISQSARSKSTSPTPIGPVRPIRPPQDAAFMAIPSYARPTHSRRIVPSPASIEASASRGVRPILVNPQSPTRPTLVSSRSAPTPHHRSASEQSLPPPPRKVMPVNIASSGTAAQVRRGTTKSTTRPNLRPLNTTPVTLRGGSSSNIQVVRSPSPVTPETRSSSASPKTPAPNVEPAYLTSDDESKSKNKRTFKSMFGLKRPDSLVSSATYTSAVSGSGTSNASNAFGSPRPKMHKAPSTFGGLAEDDVPMMAMQTRHGIKRHGHPVSEAPYPISFEEIVLQGEKHTQELLTTVLQQKAWHFTPMDNFPKLKNILDIGCGRGYWLTEAVKECKNANLVGFDLVNVFMSQQDMRQRLKLTEQQIGRIEFVQGNFFNTLPFQDSRFDYIRLAFLELAIPESKWVPLLKEAWRILKPGGHIEVVIESQLFPTVWSYDKLPVQEELEDEFRSMLEKRDIPPATNIGEKMFFDAYARVQTHKHVSVCIAPRPAGRSSLDGPMSPAKFSSVRSVHSPWTSEPIMSSGLTSPSPTPYGRPSLDRSRTPVDILPPAGQLVTSKTCTVPGIVVSPDVFIPVPEDMLFTYASHGAMVLNATRLASFSDKYPDAMPDEYEEEWQKHVERYWQYERSNRLRLGFRMKQFDDDEDDDVPIVGPTHGRWKWAKCDEDLERPLEIRRFRAWSLSKPFIPR